MGNPKKIPKLSFKWTLSKNKKNRSLFWVSSAFKDFQTMKGEI